MANTITKGIGVLAIAGVAFTGGIALDKDKQKVADTAYSKVVTDKLVSGKTEINDKDTLGNKDTVVTPTHVNRKIESMKITGVNVGDSVQVMVAVNGTIYFDQMAIMTQELPKDQMFEFQGKFKFTPCIADTLPMRVKIGEMETVEFDKDGKVKIK